MRNLLDFEIREELSRLYMVSGVPAEVKKLGRAKGLPASMVGGWSVRVARPGQPIARRSWQYLGQREKVLEIIADNYPIC